MEKSIVSDCGSAADNQDFDVFSAMDWKDGIATLPGSNLKFRVNEFDALEIITDETEVEKIKKATATTTWNVPTAQEALSRNPIPTYPEEPPSMDGILCCENCGHYGTTEEFGHRSKFCSETCMQQAREKISVLRKEPSTCNNEEVARGNRKKRQKPVSATRGDIKENGEMLKEEEDDIEEKQGELKVLKITQNNHVRARRKRKGDSGLLKQTLTFGGKRKAWCWASYLEEEKAVVAPTKLFKECQSFPQSKNGFKVGMKLEGIDPEHPSMYCVLSVAEVCGYRIRLHFDKYSDCYDFWVNADSSDIHPVGWCEKTGHKLHPPKGYKDDEFNWPSYLKLCKAQAVPKSLFENQNTTITPLGFRVGMKLEAVDRKNPEFICVATVSDMVDNRFLVHFDNWDESYDYCYSALGCPYSEINLNRENVLQDRLSGEVPVCTAVLKNKKVEIDGIETTPSLSSITSHGKFSKDHWFSETAVQGERNAEDSVSDEEPPYKKSFVYASKGRKYPRAGRPLKHPRIKQEEEVTNKVNWQNENKENDDFNLQQALHQSVFLSSASPVPSLPLCWEQHSKLLPGVAGITARKVAKWTIDEVSEFILSLPGCEEQAKAFRHEQIDGEALLLLTQTDIVKIMSIKLGPALKIYNSILMFKTTEENGQNEL
ncbi:lethal(3)malignant brain tumor-like protein 3 [Rhincodon typus]|uniref:lethal(3)malignant brain tumor-like protein 3 n=1 Tax=Rhincodon typus TaxID=259920 RepID=UPI00202E56BF|nr:lethal(3)malignant brain tumor-like protein 3 [Rhincodon typus]